MNKNHAVDESAVIAAEADQIQARRKKVAPHAPDGMVGLAFSGGGIRSATLNLGILQGLAARGLLPCFDYLSTVSGGGYIGSWLHGVIQRYGKGDPREIGGVLGRPDDSPPLDSEQDPITFLRKFSSYLAPDLGLFSADAWVIAVIWVRNMLLNLSILFPFTASIALLLLLFGYTRDFLKPPPEAIAVICAALVLTVVFVVGSGVRHVIRKQDCGGALPERPKRDQPLDAGLCAGLMMLVAVLLACASPDLVIVPWFPWEMLAVLLILFGALEYQGGFIECYHERHKNGAAPALLGLFAFISALFTSAMMYGAMWWILKWSEWSELAWGPPVLTLVFLSGAGLLIGLMGIDFPDFGREWLSRVGAFLAIAAFAWGALYAVMIFGPYWMGLLALYVGKVAAGVITGGWLATTISGVFSAKSGKTGEGRGGILEFLARIAPPLFMVGLLILSGTAVHAALAYSTPADFVDGYWSVLSGKGMIAAGMLAVAIAVMMFMQWRVNINEFSMAHFYKNRLVRCYLGASRGSLRRASRLTGFDPCDDLMIASLVPDGKRPYYGPYAIINTAINLNTGSEMAKRQRKASSFVFTPRYTGYVPPSETRGYRDTRGYAEPDGPQIGTCMAISGAAANPDMGFHTSAPVAFLLTVFDVRLGWWLGNTRFDAPSRKPGPPLAGKPLLSELFAQTDSESQFVNLSDGGHFENLGLYELVRRRCRYIIVGDGEEDGDYTFESLGGAVRKCRADFGVEIDIHPQRIRPKDRWNQTHCVVGRIHYPDAPAGWLLYLKSSMTGDEPEDVMQYRASHADFPQQPTADQFFTEDQFESYRRLGRHIVESTFENVIEGPESMEAMFESLFDQWYPPSEVGEGVSTRHTEVYSALMRRLSEDPDLKYLDRQIFSAEDQPCDAAADVLPSDDTAKRAEIERKAFFFCLDLIQLMENVWRDLHFYDKADRENPKNQGWITVFRHWARQPVFRSTWERARYTYNPLFQQFFGSLGEDEPPKKQ